MAHIPGLRSPYDQTLGIVYFGRLLDKIRLHAAGELPEDYVSFIGGTAGGFDQRIVSFLHVNYDELKERALQGGTEEEILQWAFERGRKPTDEEIQIWNSFMCKRGWRDETRPRLIFRLEEAGFCLDSGAETMFDFLDLDEGRELKTFA